MFRRLIHLKPVDPDVEFMQKEEEIERQKDEYFEEKEKRERAELAKKCDNNEPQEQLDEFKHLNDEAESLLLNRPKMMKAKFIKKLDVYVKVMRTKLMEPNKYHYLKENIDAMRNKLMKKQKIPDEVIVQIMKNIGEAST